MNEQRIKEIFSDEMFVKNLLSMETAEDVQAALKEKGLELSVQDIHKIRDTLMSVSSIDELSEADLEEVAGGIAISTVLGLIFGGLSTLFTAASSTHNITNRRW